MSVNLLEKYNNIIEGLTEKGLIACISRVLMATLFGYTEGYMRPKRSAEAWLDTGLRGFLIGASVGGKALYLGS